MLTLYLNPSTLYRINARGLRIPPDARVFVDSGLLASISRLTRRGCRRGCFDFSLEIGHATKVFSAAVKDGRRVLAVGGTQEEASAFRDIVTRRFSFQEGEGLRVAPGFHSDLFNYIVAEIDEVHPDILVLGLGAPLQEYIAIQLSNRYPSVCIYTCGGFITQTALGGGDFYPRFIQVLGLRWLYRFFVQKGIFSRTMKEYPAGILLFLSKSYRNSWKFDGS